MPALTALLHTKNDALRLGRCLETLRPCDEIVIVDHGSSDDTLRIAHEYGARTVSAPAAGPATEIIRLARYAWILCIAPGESITEHLEASLLEWKVAAPDPSLVTSYSVAVREESPTGWHEHTTPSTRLVPKPWTRWKDSLPAYDPSAPLLEGDLLRFLRP